MPTYTLKNRETGEVEDKVCSIATMQELTDEETGEYDQIIGSPRIVTHRGSVIGTTSGDWKNLVSKIKKGSGRNNTVND